MKKAKLFLLAIPLILMACSDPVQSTKQPESPEPPANKLRIGLVMKTLTNPFFIEMEKGARKAETQLGISLIVKTAAQETSFEQQVIIMNDLIQNKLVDAIVVAPADAYHLVNSIKNAQVAGIPVVNIDAQIDRQALKEARLKNVPFISVDNEMGGYLSAKTLIADVDKPIKVAILEGIRAAKNANARKSGALRAFSEKPLVEVVASESANWKIDEAYNVTKAMFTKHPDISLIFAANDMMAIGAIKFLEDTGKVKVKVSGFDALPEVGRALESGVLVATIDQQAAEQGYQGVLYAFRMLKGELLPEETILNVKLIKGSAAIQ